MQCLAHWTFNLKVLVQAWFAVIVLFSLDIISKNAGVKFVLDENPIQAPVLLTTLMNDHDKSFLPFTGVNI